MAPPRSEIAAELAGTTRVPVLIDASLRGIIRRDGIYFAAVEIPFAIGNGYKVIEVALRLLRDEHGRRITADD
jgi:hypothetical protein